MDLDAQHYRKNSQGQYKRSQSLVKRDSFSKNAHVLDVGCGDGKITAEIASLVPDGTVLGIDASPNMISLSSETFSRKNLEFLCIKAEEFSTSKLFDDILCFSCLLWIRRPKLALQQLSKLLKPGGRLLILTYLKESSYVDFLEKTLESFPSYKKLSAFNTMLSQEDHRNILELSNLQIDTFEVRNEVSCYSTKEDLKNYLKGWLFSYVPLPKELQSEFLDQAVENSLSFSIPNDEFLIKLPYKILEIKANKRPSKNDS